MGVGVGWGGWVGVGVGGGGAHLQLAAPRGNEAYDDRERRCPVVALVEQVDGYLVKPGEWSATNRRHGGSGWGWTKANGPQPTHPDAILHLGLPSDGSLASHSGPSESRMPKSPSTNQIVASVVAPAAAGPKRAATLSGVMRALDTSHSRYLAIARLWPADNGGVQSVGWGEEGQHSALTKILCSSMSSSL